ncbi:MAG: hypothetical protein ACJ8F7_03735 [Gemmataceae bacterium]
MNGRCRLVGAMLAVLLAGGAATGGDPAPKMVYTKDTVFRLPVTIAEPDRVELAEVKLFVKSVPGEWAYKESVAPGKPGFVFRAPQDGEYWFTFVTVDKAGRAVPADPGAEPPRLIVVVDTQPPEVELRPLPATSGQVYLQVKLLDANPDYTTARAEYDADGKWMKLDLLADTPGVFVIPDKKILTGKIRVAGADKAGNSVSRIIDLAPVTPSVVAVAENPLIPRTSGDDKLLGPPSGFNQAVGLVIETPTARPVPLPALPPLSETTTSAKVAPPASLPASLVSSPALVVPASVAGPVPSAALAKDMPLVNARRCRMDLHVEPGLAPAARVEVWITADRGQTWQQKGESRDGRGPATVEFPGDGQYGYLFVVKSASGGQPPSRGDAPDGWIEVDTTRPVAEFLDVTLDGGALTISWVAHDKNLGQEPVALYFAVQSNGPWQPIAGGLANSGTYRWDLSKASGGRVFLRLEVTDRAGNVTRTDTPGPVSLDPSRPRVTVLSVTPDQPQ